MKILITGTHFTPAQATIEELQKLHTEIVYVGRKATREADNTASIESQVLIQQAIKFIPLTSGRVSRTFDLSALWSLAKIPVGFLQAFNILVQEKPDAVLSFGGYLSVPIVVAAWLLSVPVIVHEQTLVSGLSSKICHLLADKVAVTFAAKLSDNSKIVLTGNPIRKGLLQIEKGDPQLLDLVKQAKGKDLPLILITGGNQGSHIINQTVGQILDKLLGHAFVCHQTGDSKYEDDQYLEGLKGKLKYSERYLVRKWINVEDFGLLLQNSDLAICRGGINTLLELAYFSVPALVIPYPYLYQDEQLVNAQYFQKLGLAHILKQSELTRENLLTKVNTLLQDLLQVKKQASSAKKIVILDAAKRLALETITLVHLKKNS